MVERNHKAGQNPPRVVASPEEEEEEEVEEMILHLTKPAALLDSGSSTWVLSVVTLPTKILWCSTVLKQ
jgi:hypothetical protein